jgi:hypothetical protein
VSLGARLITRQDPVHRDIMSLGIDSWQRADGMTDTDGNRLWTERSERAVEEAAAISEAIAGRIKTWHL